MYNTDVDKKERQKIIAIATATAGLILALVIAIIVVAVQRPSENLGGEENGSFSISEGTEDQKPAEDEKPEESEGSESEDEGSKLGEISTKPETTVPEVPGESTTDKMPEEITSTGPADVLPMALMLGVLTSVATAAVMKKAEK